MSGQVSGQQAMTGRGDSGGAVFVDGKLAGVVSYGGTRAGVRHRYTLQNEPSPDDDAIYEYDTNLTSARAVEVMREAIHSIGANIPGL